KQYIVRLFGAQIRDRHDRTDGTDARDGCEALDGDAVRDHTDVIRGDALMFELRLRRGGIRHDRVREAIRLTLKRDFRRGLVGIELAPAAGAQRPAPTP